MINNRLILNEFPGAAAFVGKAKEFLQKHCKGKKVFCALSGGIDSSATYLLLKEAGVDTIPVFIDHGLMRIIRGKEERLHIEGYFPDVVVLDIRGTFLPQIYGEADAEGKRRLFKKAYSDTITKVIAEEKCDLLADGTILPDIEESFGVKIDQIKESMTVEEERDLLERHRKGFVKSQHNLDIEYGVKATVQPVASLTKDQVRAVLEHLGMPQGLVYRKAFPGPALSARIIGPVTAENLAFEKQVHDIVESAVDDHYIKVHGKPMIVNDAGEQEPFQAFAATGTNLLEQEVTGLLNGSRTYMPPEIDDGAWDHDRLVAKASSLKDKARLFWRMGGNASGKFDVVVRSVNSRDARTASATRLPKDLLDVIRDKILAVAGARGVYLDVTPKPPATIEYV